MFSKSDINDNNDNNRVLNKSQQPVKFAGYFIWTHCLLFFGNYPPKSHNLMMFVFCLNTPIFCTRMLEKLCTLIRGPDFKFFPAGMPPDPPSNLRFQRTQVAPMVQVFSFSPHSKAFTTNLKPFWTFQ